MYFGTLVSIFEDFKFRQCQFVWLSRVILCLEVRESRSLYVHINIFCVVVSLEFLSVKWNRKYFQTDLFDPQMKPYQVFSLRITRTPVELPDLIGVKTLDNSTNKNVHKTG